MDFVKQTAKQTAKQTFGDIEKATLTIIDRRMFNIRTVEASIKAADQGALNKRLPGSMATATGLSTFSESMRRSDGKLTQNTLAMRTERKFEVMFNPSELSFSAHGGGMVPRMNYGKGEKGEKEGKERNTSISFVPMTTRMTMNLRLIFDKVYGKDAFLADKMSGSVTGVATGIAAAVKQKVTGEDYSVQAEVEGFIGALRNHYSRDIEFQWGRMIYKGFMNNMSSSYVMFNPLGEPIRAYVDITIVLCDEDISQENMGTWEASYHKAFSESKSLVSASQKFRSLGNINL